MTTRITIPLISTNRLRMEVDGDGVTTLVAAKGCPLSCKYCINANVLTDTAPSNPVTPEELVEMVKIDDLYFQATGGGIVFGGGESLLHADFIAEFAKLKPEGWKLTAETCLNVPEENLHKVLPYLDYYIVDIKDMNPDIYRAYTERGNEAVLRNLRILAENVPQNHVKVRIPAIPRFNGEEDRKKSVEQVRAIGPDFRIEVFSYIIRGEETQEKEVT